MRLPWQRYKYDNVDIVEVCPSCGRNYNPKDPEPIRWERVKNGRIRGRDFRLYPKNSKIVSKASPHNGWYGPEVDYEPVVVCVDPFHTTPPKTKPTTSGYPVEPVNKTKAKARRHKANQDKQRR